MDGSGTNSKKPTDTSKLWKVTAVVDGQSIGFGSGVRLRVAKDRAAREALIALGQLEDSS
ncbi:hypothetical protein BS47DRAFT_892819 [Hydnum rufescens UP504]|uniref:DRBM domain-containing protein n=1 Tax=Hydnum rufescens UP504 TaxID=1448309 RepID=A0A9P6B0R9_9AGAM|nr:hypothetical protein BS47DRAFT_892819 [Hydnum rufescens UP504]